jgi:AdoMet-dependent heme synthase
MDDRPRIPDVDFDRSPFLVIWETTQACDLACLHCRAEARSCRDLQELSTLEAMALMNDVRRFGRCLFVLTGGDPAKRPDLVDLVRHGARIGLRMGLTPSGTPLVTRDLIHELRDVGLSRLAISLDGSTPGIHDRFRGVHGSFARTLEILRDAGDAGLSTQVNTTVSRHNLDDFDRLVELMESLEISLWSVFFLVPTGRAKPEEIASPEDFEDVFHRMYDLSLRASFDVKSTAAPHFRRVILQRQVEERRAGQRAGAPSPLSDGIGFSLPDGVGRAKGVNDGNGFVFVSHRGEIFPSGFLPCATGNVRTDDIVEVYREHELFRALRDPDRLEGKCGVCEYRTVCGGSRARAWALTGDPLEADPFCVHVPARYQKLVARGEAEDLEAYFRHRIPGWGRAASPLRLPVIRPRPNA